MASGGDKGLYCFDKQDDYYGRLMDRKSPITAKMPLGDNRCSVTKTANREHCF